MIEAPVKETPSSAVNCFAIIFRIFIVDFVAAF